MATIERNGISRQKPPHQRSHRSLTGFHQQMYMLCEGKNYVKFTPSLLYFEAFINILLHIIPSLLQGYLSIAERQVSAMALYS